MAMQDVKKKPGVGEIRIGPFIVPADIKPENGDGSCRIYFHPGYKPVTNIWLERKEYIEIAPEFMTRDQYEAMTMDLNDAIAAAMGTTRFDMKWRERNWFLSEEQFLTLAEFSYRSGKTIVDPESCYSGSVQNKGASFISRDDIKFLEDQGIDIDLRPVIQKYQALVDDRHNRIREAIVALNHLSGYPGWTAGKTWMDGVVCLTMQTPFMMDYRDRQGIEGLYLQKNKILPVNSAHAYQNRFLDETMMAEVLKPAYDGQMVPSDSGAVRAQAYFDLTSPVRALLKKLPEGTVDAGYMIYTNRFAFEITGTIAEIERNIRVLQGYKDDFKKCVTDLIGKSCPSALLMHYTDRQCPDLAMIETPAGQIIPLWQMVGDRHGTFMESLHSIIDPFHFYIMHMAPERKARLVSPDADIGAVDLTQKVTVRDWLARQNDPALPRRAKLSDFGRESLSVYVPNCISMMSREDPATTPVGTKQWNPLFLGPR